MKLFNRARLLFSSLILVGLVLGLQACGGGGGGAAAPSLASASRGYYEGFVTLNVAAGNLMIANPDLKAIVDKNEFNVIYKKGAEVLLYKGTFTAVNATTFKADIRVYRAGNFIATAEITNGTINAGVLKGTIVGTGAFTTADYASSAVDMELTYNSANALAPPVYAFGAADLWQDNPSTGDVEFISNTSATFGMSFDSVPDELGCDRATITMTDVVNEQTGRIRKFLTSALSVCNTSTIEGTQVNGYFTNFSSDAGVTPDDLMLIVVSDDNFAYIGILPCLAGTGACFN